VEVLSDGSSTLPASTNLCRQKRCRRKTPHENAVFFIFKTKTAKNKEKKYGIKITGSVILK
jgi:hypothetical protein